jgi:PadR family transcriptional regulator, regulatory protein PadR
VHDGSDAQPSLQGPAFLLTFHTSCAMLHVDFRQERCHVQTKLDILQGTLDLMVLRTLFTLGSLHGYGIARRIEQVSEDRVILNQGTIYTSLVRLEQRGWIRSKWGVSENNRRARFYSITRAGEKQLVAETENWERLAAVMGRVLATGGPGR